MSCGEREQLEERIWWLADPLYHEAGNERRAEHYGRKVWLSVLTPFGHDGRQHFQPIRGGNATLETLERYGWPTHVGWFGYYADWGHSWYLERMHVDTAPPYLVREYSTGRLHTLPPSAVLASPFTAAASEWDLSAPGNDLLWWPREHYARDRSRIIELETGQTGMLRRKSMTRYVWATRLDSARLGRRNGDTATVLLYQSQAVSQVENAGTFRGDVGTRLIIDIPLQPGPSLLSLEISGDRARPAARTRYGTDVAAPLSALAPGERALSQPLLVEATEEAQQLLHAEDALARIHTTTTFARLSRIGVYWEGYGFTATDTIDIEVRVQHEGTPGLLARAVGAIGMRKEVGSMALQWREAPGAQRAIQVTEGSTPVQMRNIVLDISRLERGPYRMTLSMTPAGGRTVTSERTFVVR